MKVYRPAKKRITVSVGESVRILRELQELSQTQLAQLTWICQATISAIENDRVRLRVERAKVLARALKCHPGGWYSPAGSCPAKRRHNSASVRQQPRKKRLEVTGFRDRRMHRVVRPLMPFLDDFHEAVDVPAVPDQDVA